MNPDQAPLSTAPAGTDRRTGRPTREKTPRPMNDEPTPGAPQGAGSTDPLDDTQRVDVPRYAPTPDPRPDARWAWAAPGTQPQGDRWQQPSSTAPPCRGATGRRGAAPAPTPPPAYSAPVQPATGRPRRSAAPAPASAPSSRPRSCPRSSRPAAPRVVLDRTGALDRGITQSPTGSTQQTGAQQPVTIDESSAVIDAAAEGRPGRRQDHDHDRRRATRARSAARIPESGIGSGVIYDANGWILTNRHVVEGAPTTGPGRAQGRPPVRRPRLRHRHAHRPRDRQGRRAGPPGRRDRLLGRAQDRPARDRHRHAPRHVLVLGHERDPVRQGPRHRGRQRPADHEPASRPTPRSTPATRAGRSSTPPARSWASTPPSPRTRRASASRSRSTSPGRSWTRRVAGEALTRPWIGIRFESIDQKVKQAYDLTVDNGALRLDRRRRTAPRSSRTARPRRRASRTAT